MPPQGQTSTCPTALRAEPEAEARTARATPTVIGTFSAKVHSSSISPQPLHGKRKENLHPTSKTLKRAEFLQTALRRAHGATLTLGRMRQRCKRRQSHREPHSEDTHRCLGFRAEGAQPAASKNQVSAKPLAPAPRGGDGEWLPPRATLTATPSRPGLGSLAARAESEAPRQRGQRWAEPAAAVHRAPRPSLSGKLRLTGRSDVPGFPPQTRPGSLWSTFFPAGSTKFAGHPQCACCNGAGVRRLRGEPRTATSRCCHPARRLSARPRPLAGNFAPR